MLSTVLECIFMFAYVGGGSFKKPLSTEEEEKYLKELAEGSLQARDVLIERNMRLVAHIVKKYSSLYDPEELISVGTIGLIKAINTYKCGKGSRLATYGARCVENEILMYLRQNKKYRNDISLQDTIGVDREGNEVTLEEKLSDEGRSVEEITELKEQIKRLYELMKERLTQREKEIITLRYGLDGRGEKTQREIAKSMGISRSYVSRIETKALGKLKDI